MSLTISSHPVAQHYLSVLRDERTAPQQFRETTTRLASALLMEATADLPLEQYELDTPLERAAGTRIGRDVVAVAVLRAGLGLLDAALHLLPRVRVGYVGVFRDEETVMPQEYYINLPEMSEAKVLVLEPMLATGGSLSWAVNKVKERGATDITAVCVIAAPEGVARMESDHSDVHIVVASVDRDLSPKAYIQPGLGDMGDRLFGTL